MRKTGTVACPLPGAVELDKELAADRQAEEAKTPEVAPGLRLPQDGGVLLLDVFDNDPQLVELHQNSGEINPDRKGNILRAAINPVASAKQNVELAGLHAKIQAHVVLPAIYIRLELRDQAANPSSAEGHQAPEPWDRFRIVRMQTKQDKRIAGDIKVAIYGKVKEEEKLIPTGAVQLTGGWVKVTPSSPLAAGEYAMVEMMGNEGINLYVWDFGVNPSAPANDLVLKPDKAVPASTHAGSGARSATAPRNERLSGPFPIGAALADHWQGRTGWAAIDPRLGPLVKLAPISIFDSVFRNQRENVSLSPRTVVRGGARTRHQALAIPSFSARRYHRVCSPAAAITHGSASI